MEDPFNAILLSFRIKNVLDLCHLVYFMTSQHFFLPNGHSSGINNDKEDDDLMSKLVNYDGV